MTVTDVSNLPIPAEGDFDTSAMLDDLRALVESESPSHDPALLAISAEALAAMIERHLGAPAELVDSPAGPHVWWRGGATPQVLLLGHHDTVFPEGTLDERPFAVADGRATGPGVFDMLGGIVQALHGLAALRRAGVSLDGVELLFSADEEIGSAASRNLIEERATACGAVLVLEPSGEGGAVKTGRKGCGTFEVRVAGRAAHAGLEPERGVNALIEAAALVLDIAAISNADIGTTVTPTVASAGTADNVVPAQATIRVDVRVESPDEAARVEREMAALAVAHPEAAIEVLGAVNRPPMPVSASARLFPLADAVQPGIAGVAVGGGSDGNFTAALGVPTLDGLGAVGGGAHADHEFIVVDAMPARARLIAGLVAQLVT